MATMKVAAEQNGKATRQSNNTKEISADFAVEAAKKALEKKKASRKQRRTEGGASDEEDFAVAAARKVAKLKKTTNLTSKPTPEDDFAVAAAPKVAGSSATRVKGRASRGARRSSSEIEFASDTSTNQGHRSTGENSLEMPGTWRPKDFLKNKRKFRTEISTPENYATRLKQKQKANVKAKFQPKTRNQEEAKGLDGSNKSQSTPKKSIKEKRNLNLKVVDEKGVDGPGDLLDEKLYNKKNVKKETSPKMPTREQIEMDIMKEATKVLDDIADQGDEMTAEELLRDVLKFDEEKKKEEAPGTGFVSGAFEKAKQLLREKHKQIQNSKKQNVGVREREPNFADPKKPKDELSAKEELKAMFAAGQQIADGRITQRLDDSQDTLGMEKKATTEEDVDRLISQEKSISSYARVLDKELAELEVCINNSPGEEFDGPSQNPLFDVMSGPEVYNPNVDLDAVNYPGAIPGTKEVQLPKELSDAVKQAEFAASVLANMKTVETNDEEGNVKVQYFAGKNELATEQVDNLRLVVDEATEIGIITESNQLDGRKISSANRFGRVVESARGTFSRNCLELQRFAIVRELCRIDSRTPHCDGRP